MFYLLGQQLPWPALKAVKAYARRCGHSDSAIRTGLSRAHKSQELSITAEKPKRVVLGEPLKGFVHYFFNEPFQNTRFSLILTRLSAGQDKERYQINDVLTRLGYVKCLPNAYLRYGGDPAMVTHFLAEQGLTAWILPFHDLPTLPPQLEAELEGLYGLQSWRQRLLEFQLALDTFLAQAPLDTEEGYLNYLFARSSFHKNILTQAPYLPEAYFPEVALIKANYQRLGQIAEVYQARNQALYQAVFGA